MNQTGCLDNLEFTEIQLEFAQVHGFTRGSNQLTVVDLVGRAEQDSHHDDNYTEVQEASAYLELSLLLDTREETVQGGEPRDEGQWYA